MMMTDVTVSNPAASPQTIADDLRRLVSSESIVRQGEVLARRTTLRVGGRADLWLEPATEVDLATMLRFATAKHQPVLVLGRGSNLLVRDGGIRGLVIVLCHPQFTRVTVEGNQLRCGAGARLKAVAIEARKHSLAGLEFLEGIPGTVGGALCMNAGAHGGSTFDVVVEVRLLDSQGSVQVMAGADMNAVYRSCPLLKTHIAVEAVLKGRSDDAAAIEERMKDFNEKRWSAQPAAPSAGCIFKNPASIAAGRLVDELGMKGWREGSAMVSLEHGNFIVTESGATATDVLKLINRIQERARNVRGIELETEVQIVGEEASRS